MTVLRMPQSPASGVRRSFTSSVPPSGDRAPRVLPLKRRSTRGWLRSLGVQAGLAALLGTGAIAATWTTTAPEVERSGRVVRETGALGVQVGDACSVRIAPETRAGLNCRVTIACGGTTLFGGEMLGGYADCRVEDGEYRSALDGLPTVKDGDPAVKIDLERGRARVADGSAREVEIEITP